MKVRDARFVISAVNREQYPKHGIPEIALAGRSNVGKSSFINKMINRKSLARTSQKPGKTQTLNFYLINDQFFFVDVPGYGYAKVSKKEREAWGRMIETYFLQREYLQGAILVVDMRHKPTEDDINMYHWLHYYDIPTVVIATKVDKIPKGRRAQQEKLVRATLNLQKDEVIIPFSAVSGEGKEQAWQAIKALL